MLYPLYPFCGEYTIYTGRFDPCSLILFFFCDGLYVSPGTGYKGYKPAKYTYLFIPESVFTITAAFSFPGKNLILI